MSEWSPDTRRVLRAYLRAIGVAEPLQRELARRYGVALGDVHALRVLRDLGEVPISRLGATLCIKASSATNLVDRLEDAGLVERGADPADRRVTTLRLTSRAHEALEDRAVFASSELVTRVERLTPGERVQLATLLERMLDRRGDEDSEDEVAASIDACPPVTTAVLGTGSGGEGAGGATDGGATDDAARTEVAAR